MGIYKHCIIKNSAVKLNLLNFFVSIKKYGAYDEIRTRDLSLTKAVRYLLRHVSIYKLRFNK